LELEEYAQKHELNVRFLNFQSQEALIGLYQNASLFILPSLYGETWGLVVNEAMASGLPVAVSINVGCANTLVGENQNGFTFDPLDANTLAEKLIGFHMLSDKDKHRMCEASLAKIQPLGLNYFTRGLLSALEYLESKPKRKSTLMGLAFSLLWRGRYRPI
jgi:glycosyltransferase involved in cell wall biosynthesis